MFFKDKELAKKAAVLGVAFGLVASPMAFAQTSITRVQSAGDLSGVAESRFLCGIRHSERNSMKQRVFAEACAQMLRLHRDRAMVLTNRDIYNGLCISRFKQP